MISVVLGKRYERLLFFTAPISLAAIVVCLVATASAKQKERIEARCYSEAVAVFTDNLPDLSKEWEGKKKKDEFWYLDYQLKIHKIWIYGSSLSSCYDFIDQEIDKGIFKKDPSKAIDEMKGTAQKLLATPLSAYGIALPKDATIDLIVTKITIDFLTLSRALQIVLLPVFLLWLGSLYATRYRESLTIGQAMSLAEVFPHVINVYPAFDQPSIRKRNALAPYAKNIACFVYALTRVLLLSAFLVPPTLAYIYSLYLGATEEFSILYVVAGGLVFMFTLTTFIAELLPTHYAKVFPDPIKQLQL